MHPREDYSDGGGPSIDFFISYSPADERWATWIAWELETAGYRTIIQAWDFVPGTNFIEFMDRGVSEARVVVAVLSRNYLNSRYGRMEWQAALRAAPDNPSNRLVTIRVEECRLDGLLSTITYVDLVGVNDPAVAREQLMRRIQHALAGRAKPLNGPGFPEGMIRERPPGPGLRRDTGHAPIRRAPVTAPVYPAILRSEAERSQVSVLHVAGPRFGRGLTARGDPIDANELQSRVWGDLTRMTDAGAPRPELLVVSGDLTESGGLREFDEALTFLTGLRVLLGLEPPRIVVVPGARDINRAMCRAYFSTCEADDVRPQAPYWPKWRHFKGLFDELYQGLDVVSFDSMQPWTLFAIPDLTTVVAGLNSTMAESHREEDHYGQVGETQAAWFAERLRPFEEEGWLRVGVMRHVLGDDDGTGRRAPEELRDGNMLRRTLGRRLNLMLHGPDEMELGGVVEGELPILPAAGPGRHELLVVTAEGVNRWRPAQADQYAPETRFVRRQWQSVDRSFASAAENGESELPALGTGDQGTAEPRRVADPMLALLDRVAEVCETRHDNSKVRRVDADPPYLLVTYPEDGFVRQFRVGAHVGRITRDDVDVFLRSIHASGGDLGAELVYDDGPPPSPVLREEAMRRGIRLRSFTEFQGLLDLTDYVVRQSEALAGDRRYPPHMYVPQRFAELERAGTGGEDLVGELLKLVAGDHGRFVLLLGDFGRGKTFALREVARRIPTELPQLIPIFIELRALDKAPTVDGLVAAHLANHGEELIDLRAFHYMLREGRIVLLFDGFDELVTRVTYDRAADHLETLLQAAQDKAKIIVASRTQHFKSHSQVFTALGERVGALPQRRVLNLEDFTTSQVRDFLVNRYGGDHEAADARMRLLSEISDLLGLAGNPRMLGFIADLDEERLRAVARARETLSAAGLYREILHAWLRHEEERTQGQPGAPIGLGTEELWTAVRILALRLWESGESYLSHADLTEVADTLGELADGRLTTQQTTHAVGTGSLLVRTDGGMFGFIHGSVAEWLVAEHISHELAAEQDPSVLRRRPLTQLTVDFLCDLAETSAAQEWAQRILADAEADDIGRSNAIKITSRLSTPARTDLRGASLRGEDLSYRELREVDLTGADLTDARLVDTDLTRAVLRDAKLTGAVLDGARLTGADLRGADLSRARLAEADLRGIAVQGSRWHRAALLGVRADHGLARTPELHAAAIAPGQRVEVELSPAAIGVPYGFHQKHGRLPEAIAYSGNGETLAVGSDDGGVLICDGLSGRPLRTLEGHRSRVYAVLFGPDDLLVTAAADGTARIWDVATGETRHVFPGHRDWVWPVALSPDGRTLATGDATGDIQLFDTGTGEQLRRLEGHAAPMFLASFNRNGTRLAVGDNDGTVRVWDLDDTRQALTLGGHSGSVFRLAYAPDGRTLATGDWRSTVRLWDAETGRLRHELAGHTGSVYTLDFHPLGDLLASGDTDGNVWIWDLLRSPPHGRALERHPGAVYKVAFSPDGESLATGDSEGNIRLWDHGTDRVIGDFAGHRGAVWPFVFRPDGQQLATCSNDGLVRLWEVGTAQSRVTMRGHGRRISGIEFDGGGTLLATSGNDGIVRLWDPRTGQQVRELTGQADQLISAVFHPAEPVLITSSNDGGVYMWNVATGGLPRELPVETDHVWAEAFSPDGRYLATANDDDSVRIWYRTTGRQETAFIEHRGRVRAIDFHPEGRLVATGCDDRSVRLWDVATGELVAEMPGHGDRVYAVRFNPDGSRLVSASNDGEARIWDVSEPEAAPDRCLHTLTRHTGRLWTAAYSVDGSMIATAGDDLVVRLWDASTGRHLRTLMGHTRRVLSVAFSPDGARLASAGDDGTVRMWDLTDAISGDPSTDPLHMTLIGLPDGWAAMAPDGRYKMDGEVAGQFWFLIGMSRFEPGELDPYLPEVRRLPLDTPF